MECPSCGHEFLAGQDSCEQCSDDLTHVNLPQPKRGRLHELILEDPLSQLNAPRPITLDETESVARAVDLMRKQRFGSVLVTSSGGRLSGIFTERDLCRKLGERRDPLEWVFLRDVMTPRPQTLREDDTIAHALNCMAVGGYRHIPIVRDGAPIGFVSIRGILTYIANNAL
jgi:CBS domain-containing protein